MYKYSINPYKSLKIISNYIKKTPIHFNERLSKKYNANIYLKREDLQIVRSFKIRGALNKILKSKNTSNGVICASAGNHAQGVAYTCKLLKLKCDIVLPFNTPLQKINRIKHFGNGRENFKIRLHGNTVDESLQLAKKIALEDNSLFVHPFNDIDVIEGQSTVGVEIFKKIKPNYIVSSIGGGGLLGGISELINQNNFNTKIVGVEPEGANSMEMSLKNNKIVKLENIDPFVDGASVAEIGEINFELLKDSLHSLIKINNNKLCYEMIQLYQEEGIITEPAGALSIASLDYLDIKKNDNIVCIISGGNNDLSRYPEIIEKSLIYQNLIHYFIVQFNQKPGELKRFTDKVLIEGSDINRFEYIKKTNKKFGNVLIGIQTQNKNDIIKIIDNLNNYEFKYTKIDEDDMLYSFLI